MAEMARNYHDSIQEKERPDEYGRIMATELVHEKCERRLSESEFNEMDKQLTCNDIEEALRLSNNGKAPGLDGIPYEFYKTLDILFRQTRGSEDESFNILGFLTKLYADVYRTNSWHAGNP
ncbi:hypothetical protein B0H14DRAFT_2338185 [Mycena olivaceomarginata]|nr:hypothetical protein B0H14DRAFT_2338185 [Mycena olivaceomarginata]